MSSANAAARKRRAGPLPEPIQTRQGVQSAPTSSTGPAGAAPATGLTLPQVISVLDKRITVLEKAVKNGVPSLPTTLAPVPTPVPTPVPSQSQVQSNQSIIDEFNSRFELLADEIANMKNIVISLQSYTMDVNKVLMEERIQILSEVANTPLNGVVGADNTESLLPDSNGEETFQLGLESAADADAVGV
jgi:hypothetical protein